MTTEKVRELIDGLFEEQALALGGLVAVHEANDDLVWQLVESMDMIRGRVLRRLDDQSESFEGSRDSKTQPHPAIEGFLLSLKRRSI